MNKFESLSYSFHTEYGRVIDDSRLLSLQGVPGVLSVHLGGDGSDSPKETEKHEDLFTFRSSN